MTSPPEAVIAVTVQLLRIMPLPAVDNMVDKNERGHVLLVAGASEMPGSALLTATSALRAGAGKITLLTTAAVATALAIALPELRVIALQEGENGAFGIDSETLADLMTTNFDVVVIGPGIPPKKDMGSLFTALLESLSYTNVILDAFAIEYIKRNKNKACSFLVTPNAGEVAHLKKISKDDAVENALKYAKELASTWNCVVALKGATSFVAQPNGATFKHEGGNCGLAISGSGDCLTGVIAGLVSRGAELTQASLWGVFAHGLAGDLLAMRYGGVGYLATEIPEQIPGIIHRVIPGVSL